MAPDGKLFQSGPRKGELFELKQALNATTVKDRTTALKRVVAAMTLGRDMSSLFPDVVKNTTGDLSMKKLVYLYIINYARANADLSILIVNTFIKDAVDHNPLIRALAIRTMALIPLDKITEYLCTPLHSALEDPDPYVRKTAAVCVAKLYDTNPTLADEEGFIAQLQKLISDGNPMTVANAVAALSEIAESCETPSLLPLNPKTVPRFLSALSECTEWGQVFILDAISAYVPADSAEADLMVERIIPRLQHANPAVVLAAIRVIVSIMPRLDADDKRAFLVKKMSAPVVSLLTAKPELQYVALRNISLLIRSFPTLLSSNLSVLFVSYSDPLYVKREKLDILVRIADHSNCEKVLTELVEYAAEVDVTFSQKAIDSISRIALRLPSNAQNCVTVLSNLLSRKILHVTQQVAIAVKDISRAYPNQYTSVIEHVCQSVEDFDDPNAKVAIVWIIGEHADRLPNAIEMLEIISTNISDETIPVQLQIVTACVKALLLCGTTAQNLTNFVLQYAMEECGNVDVRDRGYMYSQLIAEGLDVARQIVVGEKPVISDTQLEMPPALLAELTACLSTVATVYHKPAKLFKGKKKAAPIGITDGEGMAEEDLLGLDGDIDNGNAESYNSNASLTDGAGSASVPIGASLLDDLLGVPSVANALAPSGTTAQPGDDLLGELSLGNLAITDGRTDVQEPTVSAAMANLLSAENGKGLEISGQIIRQNNGQIAVRLSLRNCGQAGMTGFAIQLNKNMFGLRPASAMFVPEPLNSNTTVQVEAPLDSRGEVDLSKGFSMQMAMKFSPGGVVYFAMDVSEEISVLLDRQKGGLSKPVYLSTWSNVPDVSEVRARIEIAVNLVGSLDGISKALGACGIFTVAKRGNATPRVMYLSTKFVGGSDYVILAELTLPVKGSGNTAVIASRCTLSGDTGATTLIRFNETCGRLLSR